MALPRTGSDELVYIHTNKVSVTIKGQASHPDFQGVEFQKKESSLKVICDDDFDISLKGVEATDPKRVTRFSRACEYNTIPLFYEQQRYELIIEAENGYSAAFLHDNYNIQNKISQVGRNNQILSGVINFGNEIGLSDLVILVDGKRYMRVTIEVFPSKISYKEDYQALIADVTAEVYGLVFDFLKETYTEFGLSDKTCSSPVEFFSIIRTIYNDYIHAADMVLNQPHHTLQTIHETMPGYKAKRIDNRSLHWLKSHPEHALRVNDTYAASKVLAVKKQVTYNTKENQLTKYILQSTIKRLQSFKAIYANLKGDNNQAVLNELDRMINGITRRCNAGFMQEVDAKGISSSMSLVFTMAPGYRELYKYYLMLQHGLSISGEIFHVSQKDLAVLYEYWCFIKLNSLMRNDRYQLVSQDIVRVQGNGLFISLLKGQGSRVKYRDVRSGELITLTYNPMKNRMPTVTQRPDNVLTLEKRGTDVKYEYVFDAKYRIDMALPGTTYKEYYGAPGPKEDDINTMHRYRDAIVSENGALSFERSMFGAYILFPLSKEIMSEDDYKNHHFYKSIDKVNIGGLPFLPSATRLVTDMLGELIADSPDSAFERTTLPVGIEKKLAKVNWKKRDVLVGCLRNKGQLDICLKQNFYHIPKKQISDDMLPIHYVALYQSKNQFGDKDSGILYYGEVSRSRLVKRREITEIPKNSDEDYYYLKIKEWKTLSKPIKIKEIRDVNFFTNYFLLTHSSETPELKIQTDEEYRLYSELKRSMNDTEINANDLGVGFEFKDARIIFEDGKIHIYRNNTVSGEFEISDFSKSPNAVFRRIQRNLV